MINRTNNTEISKTAFLLFLFLTIKITNAIITTKNNNTNILLPLFTDNGPIAVLGHLPI